MSEANSLERLMLELINEERRIAGLAPLELELRLNDAAEDHSTWMIDTDTFSHTGVGGSAPWDRMEDANFVFSGSWSAAENIAWQSVRGEPGLEDDVADLHVALMNSPGHRANILGTSSEVIGIGIERGEYRGYDGLFVTQNFASTAAPLQINDATPDPTPPSAPVSPVAEPPAPTPAPPGDPEAVAELQIGTVTVTQAWPGLWHNVEFDGPIEDAVVVMGPVSNTGGAPVTIRVRNVTETGFQFTLEEWEYQDGRHAEETISWMAISEGTYQLADGRTITAGSGAADHRVTSIDLGSEFDAAPLVFAQVASNRGGDTVATRVDNVASDTFELRLQEEEAKGGHAVERVDWIAIESGTSTDIYSSTVGGVTHQGRSIDHDADQALFAHMQTINDADTANVRYDAAGAGSRIWIDEERSQDNEAVHGGEAVGILTADLGTYDLFA